jgi:pimeloyl-ACP methyl ester carboxylesterase
MERVTAPGGITVSYDRYGEGPPLVLVHGGFSDHLTNWERVRPLLRDRFTVYALARRGRGQTSPTRGHSVDDESGDVAAVVRAAGQPAFLLGHSYGALCALGAAARHPDGVRRLVLYEPPHPTGMPADTLARLERVAATEGWDRLVETFMGEVLEVPADEVAGIKAAPFWRVWTADAEATLHDLRALSRHRFDAERYRSLRMPVPAPHRDSEPAPDLRHGHPRCRPARRPHHPTRGPGARGHDDRARPVRRGDLDVPAGVIASAATAPREGSEPVGRYGGASRSGDATPRRPCVCGLAAEVDDAWRRRRAHRRDAAGAIEEVRPSTPAPSGVANQDDRIDAWSAMPLTLGSGRARSAVPPERGGTTARAA